MMLKYFLSFITQFLRDKEEVIPPRKGGQFREIFHISDDFDNPLPDEVLKTFYNKDL